MSISEQLWLVADELRGIASEGLTWSDDSYDRRRYERIMRLAAELSALQDVRPPEVLERLFHSDLMHVSPQIGANGAVFNADGHILLIKRTDDSLWAMPGGQLEIGETPSEGAVRETQEETGIAVVATNLAGLYDWARIGGKAAPGHLHGYVFICEPVDPTVEPVITHETLGVGWFALDDLPPLSRAHRTAVPDAIAVWRGGVASFN